MERKLSSQFYTNLFRFFEMGYWEASPSGGYRFSDELEYVLGEDVNWYWEEVYREYPDHNKSNPDATLSIPELREFCEKLEALANSPLMKALE